MVELAPKERLQPSLLDRLTDHEPDKRSESAEKRVLSMRRLRESVLRDLEWLLNCGNLEGLEDFEDYPFVAHSVVNFGLPDLTGISASGVDTEKFEQALRQAILDFEPRILRNSIKVRAIRSEDEMNRNAVVFEIEGELWAQPMPLRLFLRTELDLESGTFSVTDRGSARSG